RHDRRNGVMSMYDPNMIREILVSSRDDRPTGPHKGRLRWRPGQSSGFSLPVVIFAVTLATVLAVITVPRLVKPSDDVRSQACQLQIERVNLAARHWRRFHGSWPTEVANLTSEPTWLAPAALLCPVTRQPYTFDAVTHFVQTHSH
ncbi:MAG: hypothetical protein KDB14_06450, partial [Planctomycetales bacterium]|nr:hypothetical protein [Planctomycetales bacterium]